MPIGEAFGNTKDGETVRRLKIEGGGLTAHVMSWGAVVQDLRLAGHQPPLVLGFERFEDYPAYSPHFGAVPGRCANRIANARFVLDGKTYQVDRNFLGKHHLHGGSKGFGKRVWDVRRSRARLRGVAARLGGRRHGLSRPPDGALHVPRCEGRRAAGRVRRRDRCADPLQSGAAQLFQSRRWRRGRHSRSHAIEIEADAYLPVDDELIPTGEVRAVAGTDFDFRTARPIRREHDGKQVLYDHNFCVIARACRASAHRCRRRGAIRRAHGSAGPRSPACSSIRAKRSVSRCRVFLAHLTANGPASALNRRLARRRQPAGVPERGPAAGREIPAGDGVSLCEELISARALGCARLGRNRPMTAHVLCLGVAVQDFVFSLPEMPHTAEKYRAKDFTIVGGGCAANAAVAVARLGGKASLATRLGRTRSATRSSRSSKGRGSTAPTRRAPRDVARLYPPCWSTPPASG